MDEFLGQVTLPLNEMDAYERPRARWYKLQSKPGKEKKDKDRGELEARVAFTVKVIYLFLNALSSPFHWLRKYADRITFYLRLVHWQTWAKRKRTNRQRSV